MELQEKEAQKGLQHTGNLFRKNLQLKDFFFYNNDDHILQTNNYILKQKKGIYIKP